MVNYSVKLNAVICLNLIFQVRLRLIIDLTNTDRFYDKEEVEKAGINHVKMQCKGFVKHYNWHCVYFFVFIR